VLRPLLPVVLLLALVAAGCGGEQVTADEVPGDPPRLTVPEVERGGSEVLVGDGAASSDDEKSSSDSSSSTSADDTAQQDTQTDTSTGTAGDQAAGQAPAQQQPTDGPQNDQAPPAGSEAQRFEDFCEQNAGAC
jgi:hypothetical protein